MLDLLHMRGRALGIHQCWATHRGCCIVVLYVGEGYKREQFHLLSSQLYLCHFPHYPQANWALLVLSPGWVVLCTFEDPMGLPKEFCCEAGSFSHCCNPHIFFSQRFWGFISHVLKPWVAWSVSLPNCSSQFIHTQIWDHSPASHCLARSPLHPTCSSPSLLLVRMNVPSLTPWSLDFHLVWFSVSSGYFLFLSLLLSFFWLCEEGKCIYLPLHLGWKSLQRS